MIARKSLLMIVSLMITNLFGFISWYFITNNISQEYVGSIGFAISFLGLIGFFTDFGFSTAHIKKVSEGKDIGKCIGTYAMVKLILLTLLVLTVFVSIEFYRNIFPKRDFANSYDENVIKIMLVWMVLSNISTIMISTFVGKQEIAKSQLPLLAGGIIQSLITIYIVLNYNDVYLYAVTYIIGSAITLCTSVILMRNYSIKLPS
jgi:O-antigen/teichoic acid export membrane protein